MTDTPNGQNKQDEGKQPVEMPATEKPVEVSAPPKEEARTAEAEGKLPEGVKERTREEFEKLTAKNKELAEKLTQYEGPKPKRRSALDVFAPRQEAAPVIQPPVQQVEEKVDDIKPVLPDENGYIDVNALNQTIAQMNERNKKIAASVQKAQFEAKRAEDKVSYYEHTDKTLKVYEKHPYLDPNQEQFDDKFSHLVKLEILRQMTEEGTQDYLAAADRVKKEFYDPTKKQQPEPDSRKEETIAKRDQINALSGVQKGEKAPEQEELVRESRRGSRDAVYQRLKNSGF